MTTDLRKVNVKLNKWCPITVEVDLSFKCSTYYTPNTLCLVRGGSIGTPNYTLDYLP